MNRRIAHLITIFVCVFAILVKQRILLSIESALLSLIPVVSTTGESLLAELKKCLADFNLKLVDCIGFSSDGASNMVGTNNSVWSRVKLTLHFVQVYLSQFSTVCRESF